MPATQIDTNKLCDTLDTQTISECKETFTKLENELQEHKESSPRTTLLRACCDLLRRINNQVDPEFAGRILIFLARLLPIFDPSGFNDTEFNIIDIHKYEQTTEGSHNINDRKQLSITDYNQDDLHDDIEEGETIDGEDEQQIVKPVVESNERLSERFWKLQEYLRNPIVLYEKSTWFYFRSHLDALLSMFEANPASSGVWNVTANYLIEPRSLARLLLDGNLRRCLLTQVLIIKKWLIIPSKYKRDSQKLDKIQLTWVDITTKRIQRILSDTPRDDDGDNFAKYINHVLVHEEQWIAWMNKTLKERSEDYPKPLDDEPVSMRSTYVKKRNIGEELSSANTYKMHVIGSKDLNKLWNFMPDNWEACKSSERINVPSLKDYFDKAAQSTPDQRKELFKDPSCSFRALRLLSRQSNDFFTPSSAVIVEIDKYLSNVTDVMCKKGFN